MSAKAKVFMSGRSQAVRLPLAYRFDCEELHIRKVGDAVILEPIRAEKWPTGIWEKIRITDGAFRRPPQGTAPPIVPLDEA